MDVIIGAGATGLSYASFTNNDYCILEADSEIGGYCKTIKQDGFVWDYSGHFFHFRHPELEEYICQFIDKTTLLKCHKHTQINYKGKYIAYMICFVIPIRTIQISKKCFFANLARVFQTNF